MTLFVIMEAEGGPISVARFRKDAEDYLFDLRVEKGYDIWYIVEVPVV